MCGWPHDDFYLFLYTYICYLYCVHISVRINVPLFSNNIRKQVNNHPQNTFLFAICIVSTNEKKSVNFTILIPGKDAIAQLKTCEVDGKTYREGETYQPKDTRKTCVCTADYNATDNASNCRDINCGIEIHYQSDLLRNCAPVFPGNMRGCPIGFECRKF